MKELWAIVAIYLATVNIVGSILMGVDKSKARRK